MEFFRKTPTIPFMANRKRWYVVSAVLLIGSFILLFTRGLNFGIDFTGGAEISVSYPTAPNVESVRQVVRATGYDATITQLGTDRDLLVRVRLTENSQEIGKVRDAISQALQAADPSV